MENWPEIEEREWYYTDDDNEANPRNLWNMPVVPFSQILVCTAYSFHGGIAILRGKFSEEKGWHWEMEWSNCSTDFAPVEEYIENAWCYMFLYVPDKEKFLKFGK